MSYFRYFPDEFYNFGDGDTSEIFANLSVYAEVVDEIKDNIAFYDDYYIQEGERPDQVSHKIYGTPDYHWTFYLMNTKIRERGWPLTNQELLAKALSDYDHTAITVKANLSTQFLVGQTINGSSSGATGIIDHRHIDLGQLYVNVQSGTFIAGETITSTNANGDLELLIADSVVIEYLSAHHYEDANGVYTDIDPEVGPGAQLTEITNLDRYVRLNDELKQIRIIKPKVINSVVRSFREAISS
jgi:hypothetical protein